MGTRTASTFSRYTPGFYPFSVLPHIRPFSGTRWNSFLILTRILPFLGTCPDLSFYGTPTDSTLFRYSWGQLLVTRTDSTFSQYSLGFYHFSVLPQIRPFSGTRGDSFWLLTRIPHFPGTRRDATIFWYSHRFDPFPVLVRTVFGYSHGFYIFPVLVGILPFFCTPKDWIVFWYSWGMF